MNQRNENIELDKLLEDFNLLKYSFLDLLIIFDSLTSNFIIDLKNLIRQKISENNETKNFDFKLLNSDSFYYLMKRADADLYDALMEGEKYIINRNHFISNIDFKQVWEILNQDSRIQKDFLIRYFKIVREWLEKNSNDKENITEIKEFIIEKLRENIPKYFNEKWFDLIKILIEKDFIDEFLFNDCSKSIRSLSSLTAYFNFKKNYKFNKIENKEDR